MQSSIDSIMITFTFVQFSFSFILRNLDCRHKINVEGRERGDRKSEKTAGG